MPRASQHIPPVFYCPMREVWPYMFAGLLCSTIECVHSGTNYFQLVYRTACYVTVSVTLVHSGITRLAKNCLKREIVVLCFRSQSIYGITHNESTHWFSVHGKIGEVVILTLRKWREVGLAAE